jgi:hypothetical protein
MFGIGKARKEQWTGIVARKGHGTNWDDEGGSETYWTLDVKRDDTGKIKHYVIGRGEVSAQLYNSLNEGDKVSKPADTKHLSKS